MMELKLPSEFKHLVNRDSNIKYYSKNPLKPFLIKKFFSKLIQMIKQDDLKEVIEIGCGDGLAGYLIMKNIRGLDYYAGELDRNCILNASFILTANLVRLDARFLPYADKSFDMALFLEVFEHIKGWEMVLKEGMRIARKTLIFSVPLYPWFQLSNLIFLKNIKRLGEHPDHINQFQLKKTKERINNFAKTLKIKAEYEVAFPWLITKIRM